MSSVVVLVGEWWFYFMTAFKAWIFFHYALGCRVERGKE